MEITYSVGNGFVCVRAIVWVVREAGGVKTKIICSYAYLLTTMMMLVVNGGSRTKLSGPTFRRDGRGPPSLESIPCDTAGMVCMGCDGFGYYSVPGGMLLSC